MSFQINIKEAIAGAFSYVNESNMLKSTADDEGDNLSPKIIDSFKFNIMEDETFFIFMKNGTERLNSFKIGNWPITFIKPIDLAEAGFFYLMTRDKVQCVFCRGVIEKWKCVDVPLIKHYRHFNKCPFIMEHDVGNIPIKDDPMRGQNKTFSFGGVSLDMDTTPNNSEYTSTERNCSVICSPLKDNTLNEIIGLYPHFAPICKKYSMESLRIKSFTCPKQWPKEKITSSIKLAEAGFYFYGYSDFVKCFYCGINVGKWKKDHDPWSRHKLLNPVCNYINLNNQNYDDYNSKNEDTITIEQKEDNSQYISNEILLCNICFKLPKCIVFVPCGHFIACSKCSPGFKDCPICREKIKMTIKAYIS
jgi:baculoviral IAP repeat-containing protein 7/8